IITRLPFAVPDHPRIEAKLELVEERGGDPFTEYSLPEAILKLRRGVGRLIRTKKDQGLIIILANRVVSKPYGRAFLGELPHGSVWERCVCGNGRTGNPIGSSNLSGNLSHFRRALSLKTKSKRLSRSCSCCVVFCSSSPFD